MLVTATVAGLVVAALPGHVAAQRLVGTVRDEAGAAAVIGAELVARRAAGGVEHTARSDSAGFFTLRLPEGGSYTVEVSAAGYRAFVSEPVAVGPVETVTLELRLGREVIPLTPIRVSARTSDPRLAGFHERRLSRAFGRFLTRQDVDRHSPPRTTELLRGVSGISLTPVRRGRALQTGNLVSIRGGVGACEPALYIDGQRVRQSAESTIDDILMPQDIEGVEIYSMGGTAPAQFADPGACGVILFWTRPGGSTEGARFTWRRLAVGLGLLALLGAALIVR